MDLDGTVIDSAPGIINSLQYAIRKVGFPVPKDEELLKFIGPPFSLSLKDQLGIEKEEMENFISIYRKHYSEKGIYMISLFDGILDILKYLKEKRIPTFIATAKTQNMADIIIDYLDLSQYFQGVYGMLDDNGHSKESVIKRVLSNHLNSNEADCIMVGDTVFDMSAAKNLGLIGWGAKWGYGKNEELITSGANLLMDTPCDLLSNLKDF